MEKLLKEFSIHLLVEKRLSKKTYDVYYKIISDFCTYVENNNDDLKTIDVAYIENWVMTLDLTSRTVSKYFSALRCFFKFLSKKNIREDNPTELFSTVKVVNKLPEVHTEKDIDTLLTYIEKGNNIYSIRDKAIYELIYSAALRVSEVIALTINDYFPSEMLIRVVSSKRGKSRLVPIGKRAIDAVNEYLLSARASFMKDDTDILFLSRFGEKITRLEIWKRLNEYGDKIGIHFTVHSLRHSFATHMLENGASITAIKDMLGHSNLKTTEVYTHLSTNDLREMFFSHKKN